jgi:hypothetical protein
MTEAASAPVSCATTVVLLRSPQTLSCSTAAARKVSGGIVFAIADELKLPIRYIGVGEGIDDLKPFVTKDFVQNGHSSIWKKTKIPAFLASIASAKFSL